MRQKQKNSFISRFIRGRYFKIKFKLAIARNSTTNGAAEETGGSFLKIIKKIKIFFYAACLNLLGQIILLFTEQRESFNILKEDFQDKNNKKITMTIDDQKINLGQIMEKLKNNQIENKDQVIQELIEKLFELHKQKQKKATVLSLAGLSAITIASIAISLIVTIIMPSVRQSKASSTNGTIDPTYKYAWSENTGWINFGTANGNVHVTDSGLSGSALSENVGWVNLDNVTNDGEGNLSGYGWGENVGWVKFNPTNGGVVINSSGEFTGSALSENIGWIIFGGDYKVQTDWRPRSVRPACNNTLDDDGDGLIDYPNDAGCESLTDTNETNPGGLPPSVYNPPTPPAETPTKENPKGGFSILINNGDEYTNKREVELKLFAGTDTKRFAVSQDPDFQNATLQPYEPNNSGFQVLNFKIQDTKYKIQDTKFQIFAKFYTRYGQPSDAVFDAIILDEIPPEKPTIIYPSNNSIVKTDKPLFKGEVEKESIITLNFASGLTELININITPDQNGKWSYSLSFSLAYGDYQLKIYTQDLAKNISEEVVSNFKIQPFVFPIETQKQENNETPIRQAQGRLQHENTTPAEPIKPVEPIKPIKHENNETQKQENTTPTEPIKPVEPTKPIKQENTKTQKQENATPTEPIKPVEPIKPTEPVEPAEPVEPVEPTEPSTPTEPAKPSEPAVQQTQQTEQPKMIKTTARQEIEKISDKASSLIHSGLQSASSLINNISNQTKRGISFIASQIKGAGQTIVGALGKLTAQKEKVPPQEKVVATPIQKPIPTPEPQNLLPEKVVVKTAFGNVSLTPDSATEEREKVPEIFGLSKQEINVFVKPAKPAFGVLGQILYNKTTAQLNQENTHSASSGQVTTKKQENNKLFSLLNILKPNLAMAQNEPQTLGGWKMSEFSFSDEDNNGIYKAKVELPAVVNSYTMRTLIAYKDGNIKSIDTPLIVNSQGYVYINTKEGITRISKAKVTLFKFNESKRQYEMFNSSASNQENPQITNKDGEYSFLAAEGAYYLTAQAKGYDDYKSKEFTIKNGKPINFNIELKKKFDWLRALGFAAGVIAAIGIVSALAIFFYKRRAKRN